MKETHGNSGTYIACVLPSFFLKLAIGRKLGLTFYERENNKRGKESCPL